MGALKAMKKIITVSNRLPVSAKKTKNGIAFKRSIGGVATGMASLKNSYKNTWIGWPGVMAEDGDDPIVKEVTSKLKRKHGCVPVFIGEEEFERFYEGFCNNTIWPLFHYFVQYTEYRKKNWEAYKKVNEMFLEKVLEKAKNGDTIWVHDYHLMLLPEMLRNKLPDSSIGFFLHIPFPSFEIFRLLPWRKEIIDGLLGADLIGFHLYDYVKHFLDSVQFLTGFNHDLGRINMGKRAVKTDAFPMGINFKKYSDGAEKPAVKNEVRKIRKQIGKKKIILSTDRLDYSKGILERIRAFDLFLQKNPDQCGKVTMVLVAAPSRTGVPHYMELRNSLNEAVGRINGKHADMDWTPIIYINRLVGTKTLIALYKIADVALITPFRDGMNLMTKEFLAAKNDSTGVLIISEMAGASRELSEAVTVNPNNREEIAEAISTALSMDIKEQKERNRAMRARLRNYDVNRWAALFMKGLNSAKKLQDEISSIKLGNTGKKKLVAKYRKSKKRLLFLDYDGTLAPIVQHPDKAKPDADMLALLKRLQSDPRNEVVLMSGRNRKTMRKWFGSLGISMVSGHGACILERGKRWRLLENMKAEWKDDVKPMIDHYVERTPGSFLEEKDFSLVWHFRGADEELGKIRAWELKDDMMHMTANLDLGILEGKKVLEIKREGINKGAAAMRWLEKGHWDFIVSIGDDKTDEDVFNVLPDDAYPIKVGLGSTSARHTLKNPSEVKCLLKEFLKRKRL